MEKDKVLFGVPELEVNCCVHEEHDETEAVSVITKKEADRAVKKNGGGLLRPRPQS